jgi:4-hydroxybenzoyl-CoA thioesterase/acyl-CoA thioester hydrolase
MSSPFITHRRVEFRDTDAAGIAHFSVFFPWMEQAEHEALRHLGLSVVSRDRGHTISWPRVAASCEYRQPVRFEDEVRIEVRVAELGAKSVTYAFDFFSQDRPVASGRITAVCCQLSDRGGLSSVRIPARITKRLRQIAAAPEPQQSDV